MPKWTASDFNELITRIRSDDPTLTEVDLSDARTEKDLRFLSGDNLRILCAALHNNTKIQRLNLSANNFSGSSFDMIVAGVGASGITDFDISANDGIKDGQKTSFDALAANKKLQKLTLAGGYIGDDRAAAFAGSRIPHVDLSMSDIRSKETAQSLIQSPYFQKLDLAFNPIVGMDDKAGHKKRKELRVFAAGRDDLILVLSDKDVSRQAKKEQQLDTSRPMVFRGPSSAAAPVGQALEVHDRQRADKSRKHGHGPHT